MNCFTDEIILSFNKLRTEDYKKIAEFFKLPEAGFCDFTVGALFMWADFFDNEFSITDGALIIFGRDIDGLVSFTPPICSQDNEREVLKKLYAHACRKYGYLKLYPVAEHKVEYYQKLLNEISGAASEAAVMEDWFDYIYNADDLISLTGKKYHGQRNHINRFLRENPAYSLELIDKNNLADVLAFAASLSANNSGSDKFEAYESLSVLQLLNNYDALGQTGFLIRVNGIIAGFTIGEVVGGMLYEHIEKADKNFAGIYPFMANQYIKFMKERFPEITLVNREEDLGDAGIRYSKECYHPIKKMYKYFIKCGGR